LTPPWGPVWVEVHVDDEQLVGHPERWPQARDLVDAIARCAEEQGARLCFRFRADFSRGATGTGFLPGLRERGHEIGVHAHGRRLAAATRALRACGVEPAAAVPGLVQAGAGGRRALLRQVGALGIGLVTDHGPWSAWAYEGLMPRTEQGITVMAPTVRPYDWGLLHRDGRRAGVTDSGMARLAALERQAQSQGAAWFGLALHEHDLCAPGSLRLEPGRLDALGRFLDARVGPVAPLAEVSAASPGSPPEAPPRVSTAGPVRLADPRVLAARGFGRARDRLVQIAARRPRRMRRPRQGPTHDWLEVGGRRVAIQRHGPSDPRAHCVLCHAGESGGLATALAPFGLAVSDLTRRGWAVWLYDRAGTGRSPPAGDLLPGNPAHTEDWRAVVRHVRSSEGRSGEDRCSVERPPVVALSWSSGILPVLRAARSGDRPDALVDGEAPADRWSLVPPSGAKAPRLRQRDPWDDAAWDGLEAVAMLPTLERPYARLQAHFDHVHGVMHTHARRLQAAATAAGLPSAPLEILPGRLPGHPIAVIDALEWAQESARGAG